MSLPTKQPKKTPAERLVSYILDAARLRLQIAPYESDAGNAPSDLSIIYAVDTNIIDLFLRPNQKGPRNERGGGYGQVFDDDAEENCGALGAVLSQFIFRHLTGDRPLLLLPGHDAETRGIFDAILRDATRFDESVGLEREQIESLLEDLKELPLPADRFKRFKEEAPVLFKCLFYSESPNDELERFNDLIGDERISRLLSAPEPFSGTTASDNKEQQEIAKAFNAPSNFGEQLLESAYRADWSDKLHKKKSKNTSDYRLKPDAAALARLELINKKLLPHKRRLVLITGDEAMFNVAQAYPQENSAHRSFAELYLRHPKAFLVNRHVVLPYMTAEKELEKTEPGFVVDWLDTLLAKYIGDGNPSRNLKRLQAVVNGAGDSTEQLKRRAEEVVKSDSEIADKIHDQWSEHVKLLHERHAGASTLGRDELRRVLGQLDEEGGIIEALAQIDQQLAEETQKTWQGLFSAIMLTGSRFLSSDNKDENYIRKRNPPPIYFEAYNSANNFIQKLSSAGALEPNSKNLYASLDKLEKEDNTGYIKTLAFALMFAYQENWHVTELLAQRAISIAKNTKSSNNTKISGREAYYLCAVAKRIHARGERDLDKVTALLNKAKALDHEESTPELESEELKKQRPMIRIRFAAEESAIYLQRYLLKDFMEDKSRNPESSLKQLEPIFDKLKKNYQDIPEQDHLVNQVVQRHVITNIYMIAALLDDQGSLDDNNEIYRFCTDNATSCLKSLRDIPNKIRITRLVSAVGDYGLARFAEESLKQKHKIAINKRVEALENELNNDDEKLIIAGYDQKRFKLLVRLTRFHLHKASV